MTQAIRVYVPTEHKAATSLLEGFLTDVGGGTTTTDGVGNWLDDNNQIVTEDVTVVETVADLPPTKATNKAKAAAEMVKRRTNETAVMWEVRPVTSSGLVD